MMRKYLLVSQTALCMILVLSLAVTAVISACMSRKNTQDNMVRLHILADSDEEYAQELKLKVRDELLAHSEELFAPFSTKEEAEKALSEKLDEITATAEETLRKNGCYLPVKAEITEMVIDRREYGSFAVPAGSYTALRLTIGSGRGHNWWCVMYPPLCVPCAEIKMTDEEIMEKYGSDFDESDIEMLLNEEDYEVRFFIADWVKEHFGG